MTPPSAEPTPQQLHLSDESEEGDEEDEEAAEKAEVATAEEQHMQPQMQILPPMRMKSQRYQLKAEQLGNGNQFSWKVFKQHIKYTEKRKMVFHKW